jgi:rubredoxin
MMCPMCGPGDIIFLGQLGKLYWSRCRLCGLEFSSESELAADDIEDDRPDSLLEEIMEVEIIPQWSEEYDA